MSVCSVNCDLVRKDNTFLKFSKWIFFNSRLFIDCVNIHDNSWQKILNFESVKMDLQYPFYIFHCCLQTNKVLSVFLKLCASRWTSNPCSIYFTVVSRLIRCSVHFYSYVPHNGLPIPLLYIYYWTNKVLSAFLQLCASRWTSNPLSLRCIDWTDPHRVWQKCSLLEIFAPLFLLWKMLWKEAKFF